MDPALTTVLVLLGSLFLIIWLLVRIHDRDKKKDKAKQSAK